MQICCDTSTYMHVGGVFVLQLPDSITTFTTSALYMLLRSFAALSLVRPFTSCRCSSARFLVRAGRLDDGKVGAIWLQKVWNADALLVHNPPA